MTDIWAAAQGLVGRWEGRAGGRPGIGRQVREYKLILNGRFIMGTNETLWEPTADEPAGEVHEDLTMIGLDGGASQLVMRAFYSEGFVNEYRCVESTNDGRRLVFESDRTENGPPGMRARETLSLIEADELESTFEIAMPGADFALYTHESLRRTDS